MIGASLLLQWRMKRENLVRESLEKKRKMKKNGVLGFRNVFYFMWLKISGFMVQFHKILGAKMQKNAANAFWFCYARCSE